MTSMKKLVPWGLAVLVGLVGISIVLTLFVRNLAMSGSTAVPPPDYWPTDGWKTSTPEQQGLDSAKLADALLTMHEQHINIHSLLLIRNGRIFLDACFYPYDCTSVHNLRSVTKSVTTTLVGIAIDQGKLRIDQPMLSFFPDVTLSHSDPLMQSVTIKDLAMMANGLESTGMAQNEATLLEMESSANFMQFALDRPMATKPGAKFVYDSPGMHILSGIVQKATGMTELDYARQVLFGPLGIQDVVWPADAQGYSHGWSDLHLLPRDAAKLGFLWLHGGQWEGKQLVSANWVAAASQSQIQTGMDENYSYGWWISKDGTVSGVGRGGQNVKAVRFLNVIVVTTGAGLEYAQIDPLLLASVVDPKNPLPANPQGEARLADALQTIRQGPAPQTVPPLSAMAKSISGKTYVIDPNPYGVHTVRLTFDDSAAARFEVSFDNGQPPLSEVVGLDGVLHIFPGENGLPAGDRGYWADANTFMLERESIAGGEAFVYVIRFDGDHVTLKQSERSHEGGPTFTGSLQD